MHILGELALIFGLCLAGEGIAALIPVAFPASVVSLILLMVLLLTGVIKEKHIQTVSHFFVANMAFFFIPSFVGMLEHLELLRRLVGAPSGTPGSSSGPGPEPEHG